MINKPKIRLASLEQRLNQAKLDQAKYNKDSDMFKAFTPIITQLMEDIDYLKKYLANK